ncbi:MAG: flagellar export protein FliJ [Gammaproteobacteria bacterium]|nr:MAG: flagellar export protein FliJ [Gammaproteobacteria bacterium]
MVKRSVRLQTVLDLADRNETAAREALANAQKELNDEQLRLRQLDAYMCDYQTRIRGDGQANISVMQYANFQGFIHQLGIALEQQRKKLDFLRQQVDVCTQNWRLAHEKTKGMKDYIAVCRQAEKAEMDKREQQMLDEFSQLRNNYHSE